MKTLKEIEDKIIQLGDMEKGADEYHFINGWMRALIWVIAEEATKETSN